MDELLLDLRRWCAPFLEDLPTLGGLDTFSLLLGLAIGLSGFIVLSLIMGGGKFIIKGALSAVLISAVVYLFTADISKEELLSKLPNIEVPQGSEVLKKVKKEKAALEEKMREQADKLEEIIE